MAPQPASAQANRHSLRCLIFGCIVSDPRTIEVERFFPVETDSRSRDAKGDRPQGIDEFQTARVSESGMGQYTLNAVRPAQGLSWSLE